MSISLWPHEMQRARLPCPSPSPRACSNPCPLSRWCYLIISSSVVPFSFCLQSFPESGSLPVSQLFTSGGQSGVSSSASVLPTNIHGWFPLVSTGLISVLSKSSKASVLWPSAFFMVQLSHLYTTTGKTTALTIWAFLDKVISLLFNTLSRFVIAFLTRSKCLLISWLQSPSAVILKLRK